MATETHEPTSAQERALVALLRGASVTDAAREADVARQTVSGWLHNDPAFIAAWNATRAATWASMRERLTALQSKALDVIKNALDSDDATGVAIEVLKFAARLQPPTIGETNADEIRRQRAEQEFFRPTWD